MSKNSPQPSSLYPSSRSFASTPAIVHTSSELPPSPYYKHLSCPMRPSPQLLCTQAKNHPKHMAQAPQLPHERLIRMLGIWNLSVIRVAFPPSPSTSCRPRQWAVEVGRHAASAHKCRYIHPSPAPNTPAPQAFSAPILTCSQAQIHLAQHPIPELHKLFQHPYSLALKLKSTPKLVVQALQQPLETSILLTST